MSDSANLVQWPFLQTLFSNIASAQYHGCEHTLIDTDKKHNALVVSFLKNHSWHTYDSKAQLSTLPKNFKWYPLQLLYKDFEQFYKKYYDIKTLNTYDLTLKEKIAFLKSVVSYYDITFTDGTKYQILTNESI